MAAGGVTEWRDGKGNWVVTHNEHPSCFTCSLLVARQEGQQVVGKPVAMAFVDALRQVVRCPGCGAEFHRVVG